MTSPPTLEGWQRGQQQQGKIDACNNADNNAEYVF